MTADGAARRPPLPPISARQLAIHGGLFLAALASCWVSGGLTFACTLMGILAAHELGHWLVARHYRLDVSLPYFIPLPYVSLGTLGAVIRMGAPITRRRELIDVGAAGPLAGLVVALPLLVIGLAASPVAAVVPGQGAFTEGNSLLYLGVKWLVFGRVLPDGAVDVQLGEMALGAWVGLLLTFINLMPLGQLDGGHIAAAFFGEAHERRSRALHGLLVIVGAIVGVVLGLEAAAHGRDLLGAAFYGARGALPWLIWAGLIALMRRGNEGRYHPAVDDEPLPPSRRALFWLVAVLFVLLFTPVPMRETLP